MRIGLFVGSFDPFTIGHDDLVRRALPLFDRLVIGVGVNPRKKYMFSAEQRMDAIKDLYADEPRIEVTSFDDFAVDLAHRVGAQYIVKGVRTGSDFEFEHTMADFNKRLGNVETLLLYASPTLATISSSAVRELIYFHKDISALVPRKASHGPGNGYREPLSGRQETDKA
jgi:pantetheine-phosphate adenylyltransferase